MSTVSRKAFAPTNTGDSSRAVKVKLNSNMSQSKSDKYNAIKPIINVLGAQTYGVREVRNQALIANAMKKHQCFKVGNRRTHLSEEEVVILPRSVLEGVLEIDEMKLLIESFNVKEEYKLASDPLFGDCFRTGVVLPKIVHEIDFGSEVFE
jgi:hypothetical protein